MTMAMREYLLFARAKGIGVLSGNPDATHWLLDGAASEAWCNAEESEGTWYLDSVPGWIEGEAYKTYVVRVGLWAASIVDGDGDAD